MISVPIAVYNANFEWQLSLFWHAHQEVYGAEAASRCMAAVVRRNHSSQKRQESYGWDAKIPHMMCESYFDYTLGLKENGSLLPINIQVGLMQVMAGMRDDEVVELLDCDMVHLRKSPDYRPSDNEMIVTDVYEKWHLHSLGDNRHTIEKYVGPSALNYNGGFVPIIARVSTFKRIILDWIWMHKDIASRYRGESMRSIRWWAGMFSLQSACEVNGVKMRSADMCYVPNINQIRNEHHVAHYSVDPKFNKKLFPNVDRSKFPDDQFYGIVRRWMDARGVSEKNPKTELISGMTDKQITDLYAKYLNRKPTESDIRHHIHKDLVVFERELQNCPERKAARYSSADTFMWTAHERRGKPLDESRVKIAVGTNKGFCSKSLPVVLKSLADHGIKKSQIVVFNAGFDKRKSYTKDGIEHVELDHNSMENSAFVDIAENDLQSDFWFFLHDTCKIGPKFKGVMLDVPNEAQKVALRSWPSMSIALYSHAYIMRHRDKLLRVKNRDYSADALLREKLWGIPNEDLILWLEEPEQTLVYRNQGKRNLDSNNWFGGSAKRVTEYYPHMDLYKNKSDWNAYQGRNLSL